MNNSINSYRDLSVWQLGMDLTETIYSITVTFPDHEKFGLTSQLRRAAMSIPANIAEGHGRDSTKEYLRHISIAIGSLFEVETFVQLATRIKYLSPKQGADLLQTLDHEGRMLRNLQRSLRSKLHDHPERL